jgi:hypothetical protein
MIMLRCVRERWNPIVTGSGRARDAAAKLVGSVGVALNGDTIRCRELPNRTTTVDGCEGVTCARARIQCIGIRVWRFEQSRGGDVVCQWFWSRNVAFVS